MVVADGGGSWGAAGGERGIGGDEDRLSMLCIIAKPLVSGDVHETGR